MNYKSARSLVSKWLTSMGVESKNGSVLDKTGQCTITDKQGTPCLLQVPENDPALYFYSPIRSINPSRDGHHIALALALNLEPQLTRGASLALHLQHQQLVLCYAQPLINFDEKLLDNVFSNFLDTRRNLMPYFAFENEPNPVQVQAIKQVKKSAPLLKELPL